MNRVGRGVAIATVGLAFASVSGVCWGEDELPGNFATLNYTVECDAKNRRLVLTNTHTYRSMQVVVRWRAFEGKDLQDQFFSAPDSKTEIGCAADSQIVEAKFVDF